MLKPTGSAARSLERAEDNGADGERSKVNTVIKSKKKGGGKKERPQGTGGAGLSGKGRQCLASQRCQQIAVAGR